MKIEDESNSLGKLHYIRKGVYSFNQNLSFESIIQNQKLKTWKSDRKSTSVSVFYFPSAVLYLFFTYILGNRLTLYIPINLISASNCNKHIYSRFNLFSRRKFVHFYAKRIDHSTEKPFSIQ